MPPTLTLKTILPAAALLAGYIDAKADLTQDVRTISAFFLSNISFSRAERRNRLNLFYELESAALNPAHSSRPFLLFEGKSWTYKQAYEQVLRYGSWLKDRHGVKRDEMVAIDFINKPVFLWLWLGLWGIGARAAFVNYNLGGEALVHTIRTSRARLILVDYEVAEKVFSGDEGAKVRQQIITDGIPEGAEFTEREVLIFDEGVERVVDTWQGRRESDELIAGRKAGDMGALVYTSGTTGLPKAANISFSKTHTAATFVKYYLRMRPTDIFYTCMPLYHTSAALLGVAATIHSCATLSLGRKFSNRTFWPEVKSSHATIIQYVGETCRYLLAAPPPPDPEEDKSHCVRIAFGNGLRPEIWEQFRTRFGIPVIAEFYASTEGSSGTWNYNTGPHGSGAVGRAGWLINLLVGRRQRIVKLDYETELPARDPKTGLCIPVGLGEPGELLWKLNEKDIRRTFQGYFNNTEATEKKILRDVFRKGDAWFRTGDVQRLGEDGGLIYFIDRIGDTYRWKSENISTNEVAEIMSRFPTAEILECNVYGVQLPNHDGRAGCAAIRFKHTTGTTVNDSIMRELGEWAKTQMPRYMVPVFVRTVMGEMELTGTNKFVKTRLRREGVDPEKVGVLDGEAGDMGWVGKGGKEDGDRVWWLGSQHQVEEGAGRGYVPFRKRDWDGMVGGKVKL